jgi:hypothetical protein
VKFWQCFRIIDWQVHGIVITRDQSGSVVNHGLQIIVICLNSAMLQPVLSMAVHGGEPKSCNNSRFVVPQERTMAENPAILADKYHIEEAKIRHGPMADIR